ncbi:MAG: hypothetical protein V3U02_12650 [Calditrichia bacterium]
MTTELTTEFVNKVKKLQRILKQNSERVSVDVQIDDTHHTQFKINWNYIKTELRSYSFSGKNQNVSDHGNNIDDVLQRYEDRKKIWDRKIVAKIEEKIMTDDWNDDRGTRVSLEDIDNYIISNNLFDTCYTRIQDKTSILFEDYDEYGYEHYIKITGEYADLIFNYKYGGGDFGNDYIECYIDAHGNYKLKTAIHTVIIDSEYETKITKFMAENKKYIEIDFDKTSKQYFNCIENIESKL